MNKTPAEKRFETARKRLSGALAELEEVMKEKLHEAAMQSKMINGGTDEESSRQAVFVEQAGLIENLNSEINNLQKNLSDLGRETEFLNEKNKTLGKKISDMKNEGMSLIEAVEAQLVSIEAIINDEENHDS